MLADDGHRTIVLGIERNFCVQDNWTSNTNGYAQEMMRECEMTYENQGIEL